MHLDSFVNFIIEHCLLLQGIDKIFSLSFEQMTCNKDMVKLAIYNFYREEHESSLDKPIN